MYRHLSLLACSVMLALAPALAQEICNNGIDDDADGLIDLNDTTDCVCSGHLGSGSNEVSSIIPNPSFEDYDCIPTTFSQLDCASIWQQATDGTSDFYLNVSGGLFPTDVIPQPIPDGIGCAGFITTVGYNEYIGGCLLQPMQAGVPQTLRMGIAGGSYDGFSGIGVFYGPVDITIFGSTSCPSFPLPGYDCPVGQGWVELGHTTYQGINAWEQIEIDFTPSQDILAVMIGGPCDPPPDFVNNGYYPYFWVDGLTLNETSAFTSTITETGGICTDDLQLIAHPDTLAGTYQWYHDGVALVGRTDTILDLSAIGLGAGTYQFMLTLDTACALATHAVLPPVDPEVVIDADPTLGCSPLTVHFTNATANSAGCAWDFGNGVTSHACDTVVVYDPGGQYTATLTVTGTNGCVGSGTATINAGLGPHAAFTADPQPTAINDTYIQFTDLSTGDIIHWQWYFGAGGAIGTSDQQDPAQLFPAVVGNYPVTLVVVDGNGCTDTLVAMVQILGSLDVDMPNVFSPNGDGENDRFVPLLYAGVGKAHLSIYNRWGQEVFTTTDLASGWNGAIAGTAAPEGTYFWALDYTLRNDPPRRKHGHVTLLR